MTDLEKYKDLFVSVSERLPEIKVGETIEVFMIFKYRGGREEIKTTYLKNDVDFGIEVVDFLFAKRQMWEFYTHWLDLSQLTTKSKALELADKAAEFGFDCGLREESYSFNYFINENKDIL